LKTKQVRPQRRLLGGESVGVIIIILPFGVKISWLKTKLKTNKKSWKRLEVRLAVG